MRRMTSVLQLGVGVVLLFTVVVVVPAASQQWCNKRLHDNYGCQTLILATPDSGKCQFETQGSPDFSFYLRPGPTFTSLQVRLTWTLGVTETIYIGRDVLDQPNKWYRIHMTSHASLIDETYYVYVDGQERRKLRSILVSANTFDIYVIGSIFYARDCDPSEYPPPRSTPAPPAALSPPTTPSPVQSTDDAANVPGVDLNFPKVPPPANTTENIEVAEEHSTTEDSSKPESDTMEATTRLVLGLPWYIVVTVGVIAAAVVTIIIATLVIKTRKRKEKNTNLIDQETGSFPLSFSGSQNSNEDNYDDVDDPEDHIYEDMNDLHPVAGAVRPFSTGEEGVDASVGGGWNARKGSAHDSENSLYVGLGAMLT
ncbi:uncharacterized protein [Procambarus clarkii]|uniref:uncharacterized protein n=1 Tax=Procambarus clarkii TaxID=6728 RepID=UPI0037433C23